MSFQSPLEGRLVRLRAFEPQDEALLLQWANDPAVTEYLPTRYPWSHAQEKQFLEERGRVGYGNAPFAVDVNPENRNAILGIAIGDPEYRGRGYGTDTMRVLCRFGFEMMNLHRIELEVFAANEAARHVYASVGFREETCRRQAIYKFGRYHDLIVMALLEGELTMGAADRVRDA
jgi:RimJ/RimL family protein N-acetyltransferase